MPNKKTSGGAALTGLAALAAAAAGAYYFYGSKHSAENRRKMKSWAVKASGEVMEKMEQMKDISQGAYHQAVDQVVGKYKKVKNIPPAELAQMAKEMKAHWNRISAHLQPTAAKPPKRKKSKTK